MAKTKSGQKYENIDSYKKADGTVVKAHRRSNPSTSTGAATPFKSSPKAGGKKK